MAQIETTFCEEHGRTLAALISQLDDFPLAGDALEGALVSALERWEVDGIPPQPRRQGAGHCAPSRHRPGAPS